MTQRKLSPKGYPIPQPKGPRPSGPRGRRKLPPRGGGWVPLPGGRRGKIDLPTALPPFPLPAPFRRALRIVNPIQRYKDAWDIGTGIGKYIRSSFPELLPFSPAAPAAFNPSPGAVHYDCPSIHWPYATPAMIRYDTLGGSSVPSYMRCTTGQVPSGQLEELPQGQSAPARMITIGPGSFYDAVTGQWRRMSFDLVWRWPAKGPQGTIKYTPARPPTYVPAPRPEVWPNIDPLALPIHRPMQHPRPLPMRVVRHMPANLPFTRQSGYGLPGIRPMPAPTPGPTIIIAPKPSPQPEPYRPGRPPKGTRERKILSDKKLAAPRAILEGLSEIRDAVGAFHDALPKYLQAKNKKDLDAMLKALYQNSNAIDLRKAILNLIRNQAEDQIIGRLDAAINKAGIKLGVGGAAIKNPITSAPQVRIK